MARYAIEDKTLTAIGDAIRNKVGEYKTKETVVNIGEQYVTDFYLEKWDDNTAEWTYQFYSDGMGGAKFRIEFTNQELWNLNYYYNCLNLDEDPNGDYDTEVWLEWDNTFRPDYSPNYNYYVIKIRAKDVNYEYGAISGAVYAEVYDWNGDPMTTTQVETVKNTFTPEQMAEVIDNDLDTGLTEEELTITNSCRYRFAYNGWNWFINNYKDKITTKDIYECSYMFYNSNEIKKIHFDINCWYWDVSAQSPISVANAFYGCNELVDLPKINNILVGETGDIFSNCYNLKNIPEDFDNSFIWDRVDSATSASSYGRQRMFNNCYSLRSLPMNFLRHGNPKASYSYSIYYSGFNNCYALDKIEDLPFPHKDAAWTSNSFPNAFNYCSRLKEMTFALQDNGTPYTMNWTKQTIDLSSFVGYVSMQSHITGFNAQVGINSQVNSDSTYQALKNTENWWTIDIKYSRNNHDSAVNTIMSLPFTNGGNTIKFKGASGSLTDGGAINTLTAEEIAVAASKGWTVSLV